MMTSDDFRAWRKGLGWKQKEAAERLGLKKRMIQYYEKGNREGKDVKIPTTVRLACYALSLGIADFDGKTVTVLARRREPDEKTSAVEPRGRKPAEDDEPEPDQDTEDDGGL